MSKHTKGPWEYTYKRDPSYGEGEITDADGNMLAIVSGSNYGVHFGGPNRDWEGEFDDEDEHEANARLIAAAPELLEALERLQCAAYNIGGEHVTDHQQLIDAADFAQAAIAKARGEA